ncbi:hypothetical protein D3C78_1058390 [compost metagenome]
MVSAPIAPFIVQFDREYFAIFFSQDVIPEPEIFRALRLPRTVSDPDNTAGIRLIVRARSSRQSPRAAPAYQTIGPGIRLRFGPSR